MLVSSSNNTIGEALTGGGNVISGNGQQGVEITGGPTAQGNQILGNDIGTDIGSGTGATAQPAGVNPRPNQMQGILIEDSPNNIIGGLTADAQNVIAGNDLDGVLIDGPQSTGNVVRTTTSASTSSAAWSRWSSPTRATASTSRRPATRSAGRPPRRRTRSTTTCSNGIELTGAGASGNVIQGNVIGLNPGERQRLRQHARRHPHRRRPEQRDRRDRRPGRGT